MNMAVVTIQGKPVTLDHIAELRPAKGTPKGPRWAALFDGERIVEASPTPEFAACRVLRERGVSGTIGFARDGMVCIVVDIDVGAGLTVVETQVGQPRFAKWQPFEPRDIWKKDDDESRDD